MSLHKDIIERCVNTAIDNQCSKVINNYIKFWTPDKDADHYPIDQLDFRYYFLVESHRKRTIDIFSSSKSLYYTLFLV